MMRLTMLLGVGLLCPACPANAQPEAAPPLLTLHGAIQTPEYASFLPDDSVAALRAPGEGRLATGLRLQGEAAEDPAPRPATDPQDADAIARELSNPTNARMSLGANFLYQTFDGDLPDAEDQDTFTLLFQPSLPFPQENGYNLIFRPALPLFFDQPVFNGSTGEFEDDGLQIGDLSYDLAYGTTTESGILYLGGIVGAFPTATNSKLGRDQLTLGPEIALGLVKPWGVIGTLITHQWDIAGEDDFDTNITGGQYFYAFGLGGGYQFAAGPTFSFNHEAKGDDKWTFPLGVGVSKTKVIGSTPVKLALQTWYYAARPDSFGPEWEIRFTLTPVVTAPW